MLVYGYEIEIKRSSRKTICLEIKTDGKLLVRCNYITPIETINKFVFSHSDWIEKHLNKVRKRADYIPSLDETEIVRLKRMAKAYLTERTEYFSSLMNLKMPRVKITSAKKRLGSCNSNGGICYSYLLMTYDNDVIDYVVIHELSHIKELNHSSAFYRIVKKYCPDYKSIENKIRNK